MLLSEARQQDFTEIVGLQFIQFRVKTWEETRKWEEIAPIPHLNMVLPSKEAADLVAKKLIEYFPEIHEVRWNFINGFNQGHYVPAPTSHKKLAGR